MKVLSETIALKRLNPSFGEVHRELLMSRTGFVFNKIYLEHDTGLYHPERAERLSALLEAFRENGIFERVVQIEAFPAERSVIELCHDKSHIERVKRASESGVAFLDTPDCPVSPSTFNSALYAVGGVLAAVDAVMAGKVDNCFVAVRPPGHHAERARAMGFCFFNNVAIAARYAQKEHGIERVMILDWDVHHGNGTQHLFEDDPTVFYISLHEDPSSCYPGTGRATETGKGPGEGYTLNFPMPPGAGNDEYLAAMDRVEEVMEGFEPQFVFVSAGFDAHRADPLAHIDLTEQGYAEMTRRVKRISDKHAKKRLVSVLEGGYNLAALRESVLGHMNVLMNEEG